VDKLSLAGTEMYTNSIPINAYECQCIGGWGDPECGSDDDECASSPCMNGAACFDSLTDGTDDPRSTQFIPLDVFQCRCLSGFTNGACDYNFIRCADRI
jgi:hypothetical protein